MQAVRPRADCIYALVLCCSICLTTDSALAADEPSPQILVTGADEELTANILASIGLAAEPCRISLSRLNRLQPQVLEDISTAAQALGYYDLQATTDFEINESCWSMTVTVEPGAPVLLDNVNIQVVGPGENDQGLLEMMEELSLVRGSALHHGDYEAFKSALGSRALDLGYLNSTFTQTEVSVYPDSGQADINLRFETGNPYYIGDITIENDSPLSEGFVQRLMGIEAETRYSSELMFTLRENLDNSQYFEVIEINPETGATIDETVPVNIRLSPRPRYAYTSGVGFTTDTGPRLRFAYDNRYINSRGHRFSGKLGLSSVRQEIEGTYSIPLRDPVRQSLEFTPVFTREVTDTFESKRFNLVSSVRNEFRSGWLGNVYMNYQYDDYIIEEVPGQSTLALFGASLARTRADDMVFPSRGWHLFGQIQGALDSLLSDTTLVQAQFRSRYIGSAGPFRFLGGAEFATTWIDEANELPASLRFFTGGDQSIRGYKYRTLGPQDAEGNVIGGKHMVALTAETDFRIYKSWRGALFVDSGNAFSDFDNVDWHHSVGAGVRWISPLGPIRLDLAHPVKEGGIRLHITMGPDL